MKLSEAQRQLVQDNMGLVGKVIKDKVHGWNQPGLYTYDDLFQIGCIGLCKAAATDKGGCFSTYAYRLIWNEICNALIYATRREAAEQVTDPELMPSDINDETVRFDSPEELLEILSRSERKASGVVAKGIRALRMMANGHTCREIGKQMGTTDKNVSAWISKARKYLRTEPDILEWKNI